MYPLYSNSYYYHSFIGTNTSSKKLSNLSKVVWPVSDISGIFTMQIGEISISNAYGHYSGMETMEMEM